MSGKMAVTSRSPKQEQTGCHPIAPALATSRSLALLAPTGMAVTPPIGHFCLGWKRTSLLCFDSFEVYGGAGAGIQRIARA